MMLTASLRINLKGSVARRLDFMDGVHIYFPGVFWFFLVNCGI